MNSGLWLYSTIHRSPCRFIEETDLWGTTTCTVILPDNRIVSIPKLTLEPLTNENTEISPYYIRYIILAAKIAEVLELNTEKDGETTLLAPIESNVIPLPHQVTALKKAISDERIRYLLADEVGLGKTIEAGLILRELKLRGLIKRILIIAPKGLTEQWVSEMKTHFNEQFNILLPEDIQTIKKVAPSIEERVTGKPNSTHIQKETNPWTIFNQVIVPMDSVKPLEKRKGWSREKIFNYNKDRFEGLITAGWDLVIVDESHRLGGSTDLVARYKLGKGLSDSSPYLLLLSATPHQGKTESFFRLISLLDNKMFPDPESINRETVSRYVIRTIKRNAIDSDGNPLFKPRKTHIHPVNWSEKHNDQKELYEAVTEYIKIGYNEAIRVQKQYIGFLMVLMQRLVTSSTAAIEKTLERRLEILTGTPNQDSASRKQDQTSGNFDPEEYYDYDGQELLDTLIEIKDSGFYKEYNNVAELLHRARTCRQKGPDAKAEELLNLVQSLKIEEKDPNLKVLIFTEFIPTQEMLSQLLTDHGFNVEILNGKMSLDERNLAQKKFMQDAQFLISTDAGGEGLNLQFCHVVINYDIPWNPMRLEQRIGRVDRIGQEKPVKAINFIFENSIEFRVREVLEEKLSIIYEEFGVDKTGDVLDSAIAGEIFEDLFIEAITDPDTIESSVDKAVSKIEAELVDIQRSMISTISDTPDIQLTKKAADHPFSYWLEMMTISYLHANNGTAKKLLDSWDLTWPDGTEYKNAVFTDFSKTQITGQMIMTPEEEHIMEIITNIPEYTPDTPVPMIKIPDLPGDLKGCWGLFEIGFTYEKEAENLETLRFIPAKKRKYLPVFISEDNIQYRQTAFFIWDCLTAKFYDSTHLSDVTSSKRIYEKLISEARTIGESVFSDLKDEHMQQIQKEKYRAEIFFSSRKRAIDKIGLPQVRNFRQKELQSGAELWERQIKKAELIIPNLKPLIIIQIT